MYAPSFKYNFKRTIVLFTDGLLKKLEEMERTANMYGGLICQTRKLLKAIFDLSQSHKGDKVLVQNFSASF